MHFGDAEWSTERPTEPGRYWVKQCGHKWVAHVWFAGPGPSLYVDGDRLDGPEYDSALWWTERLHPPEG